MSTLVLGSQGQLGRDLCPRLAGPVVALTREHFDLARPDSFADLLTQHTPGVVVNCAAYNLVDKAESHAEAAFAVNAHAPGAIARACAAAGVRLVHVSTDYVFGLDEGRTTPYEPADAPGPVSQYGLSKLAGEYAVRMASPGHLVVRTCGLFGVWGSGGKGGNFVETMLRVAGQGKPLRVVADQHCTPSYTADVAEAIARLIAAEASGLVHVTNAGATTWHDFASEIFRQAGVTADLSPIPTSGYPLPARRPGYSVLSNRSLERWGVPAPRAWEAGVGAYLAERARRG